MNGPHPESKPEVFQTDNKNSEPGARAFVWGIWAILSGAALIVVFCYGTILPHEEDWMLVPYLTGGEPITPSWLWLKEHVHRSPFLKIIFLTLLKLSGGDFRVLMVFTLLLLSGLAFAMIRAAKFSRGWTGYTDAIFPFALIPGGAAVPGIFYQNRTACFTLTFLAAIVFLIILRHGFDLTIKSGLLAGICLMILPLCSAAGVFYVPGLALWLGIAGILHWGSSKANAKRTSIILIIVALIPCLIGLLILLNYQE